MSGKARGYAALALMLATATVAALGTRGRRTPSPRAGVDQASGEQRRWTLDFRVRLEQPGREHPVENDLAGDWVSSLSEVRDDDYDVALEIVDARVTSDGIHNSSRAAIEQVRQRLARRFWATYRNDGALVAIHFPKDIDPSDRNMLQMIATETQLVRPPHEELQWTVLERDAAGSYLAIYVQPEHNVIVKRKLKYVTTDGAAGAPAGAVHVGVDQSEHRFSLDADGNVTALSGSDRARIGMPFGESGQLATVTATHLSNLRRSRAPELAGSLARARAQVESSPIVTHTPDPGQVRAQRDERLLEGRATASLLEGTHANDSDQLLASRLAALFRRRPEAIPIALAQVRKNGGQKRLTDALGAASSAAAVEALGDLALDRDAPVAARTDALTALVLVQHPTAKAMRVPVALLDDSSVRIQSTARLMSGAVARAGRSEHPAEAEAIDMALIARYRNAAEVDERSGMLAALGNSVGPSVLPPIEDALRDPRASVRAAAARALRLSDAPETDSLLAATITADIDPGVREAAIFAASFRRVGPLAEALMKAASDDPIEYVRSKAITLLWHNSDASARVADTLTRIAEHDAKPGIRHLAQEALASMSR